MKILSIIPAREGSKGIPLKNIIKLDGKPLLAHTISASLNSKINRTVVSTDSKKISNIAKKYGAEVIIRPKKLANDKSQIEPSMEHVLNYLKKTEVYVPDIVVLLQNTSPLRTSKNIDDALRLFQKGKYDSVFSGYMSHSFIWDTKGKSLVPKTYNPLKRQNRQKMKNQFYENGAIYITKYDLFDETKCRISGKTGMSEMTKEESLQIDSKYDLFLVEQYIKWRKK